MPSTASPRGCCSSSRALPRRSSSARLRAPRAACGVSSRAARASGRGSRSSRSRSRSAAPAVIAGAVAAHALDNSSPAAVALADDDDLWRHDDDDGGDVRDDSGGDDRARDDDSERDDDDDGDGGNADTYAALRHVALGVCALGRVLDMVRLVRAVPAGADAARVLQLATPAISDLLVTLFVLLHVFATVGILAFGERADAARLEAIERANNDGITHHAADNDGGGGGGDDADDDGDDDSLGAPRFYLMNFETYPEAMVTLFVLLQVNVWNVIATLHAHVLRTRCVYIYFVAFQVVAVTIALQTVTSLFLAVSSAAQSGAGAPFRARRVRYDASAAAHVGAGAETVTIALVPATMAIAPGAPPRWRRRRGGGGGGHSTEQCSEGAYSRVVEAGARMVWQSRLVVGACVRDVFAGESDQLRFGVRLASQNCRSTV